MPAEKGTASPIVRVEVKIHGPRMIGVRVIEAVGGGVRVWDDMTPGEIHSPTGLSYEQLRALGDGVHPIG